MTLSSLLHEWKVAAKFSKKSYTQVETLVVPPVALLKSCGLKPKRKQSSPVNIRLNQSEKEVVKRKAERANMSVHAFVKSLILGADYDPHLRNALLSVNRELTAQGRNFNQITKLVNSGYIPTSQSLETALNTISTPLVSALHAVKTALSHGMPQP